jgi:hypothetical protein
LPRVQLLAVLLVYSRRMYRAEIDRMADAKRALEERIDPDRPRTYLAPPALHIPEFEEDEGVEEETEHTGERRRGEP